MFLVVICHSVPYIGLIHGHDYAPSIAEFVLICDPIFFALSGFFAIRPLKSSYVRYLLHKVKTVVLPLLIYTTIVYFFCCSRGEAVLGMGAFLTWSYQTIGGQYWFVPALIPFIMIAPLLHSFFSALNREQTRKMFSVMLALSLLGFIGICASALIPSGTIENAIGVVEYFIPAPKLLGTYFPYFCLGYLVKQIPDLYDQGEIKFINGVAWAAWLIAIILSAHGYRKFDPDYVWFIATVAIFDLFNKLSFNSRNFERIVNWIAKRSYSIYLLQAEVIFTLFSAASSAHLLDADIPSLIRLPTWALNTTVAFLISLIVATLIDNTVVRFVQALFSKLESSR